MAKKPDLSKKALSILDAAAKVFQEEGYEKASMDRIAEVSNSSKRTVYNYFPSKEELFITVVRKLIEDLQALKQIHYDPAKTLEEQLEGFVEAKLAAVKNPSWRGVTKAAFAVFIRDPEFAKRTIAECEAGEDTLAVWLGEAVKDNKLRVEDIEVATKLFWATLTGAFIWPSIFHDPVDEQTEQILKAEVINTFLTRYRY